MVTTLEALEARLAALEQEVARLRRLVEPQTEAPKLRDWGSQMIRDARAGQAALNAVTARVFAEMGITGEPVGAEKLQQMMIEAGINPADNAASREIIAMREE